MSRRTLGPEVKQFLANISQLLHRAPFGPDNLKDIIAACRPDATVAGAFRELLEAWLAPLDLCLADAADAELKRISQPALEQAVAMAGEQEAALSRVTARLEAAGYVGQVPVLPGATNLCVIGEGGRERLYRSAGGFTTREARRALSEAQVRSAAAEHPESLSPNVFLRPVVESVVFPSLAYVGGPSEIAYFAQAGALFGEYGITPPVVYPRASVMLAERSLERELAELGLSVDDLATPRHELVAQLARSAMPEALERALAELRRATAEGYQRLIDDRALPDASLRGALGRLRNEALSGVRRGEEKILRSIKIREADRISRLDRVRVHLYPKGAPQERVLNVAQFLADHGPALLDRLRRATSARFEPPIAAALHPPAHV